MLLKKKLARKIKGLVSKKKIRYKEDGFDLDLTYITDRIIAMGLPSQGTEGIYRNPISEVVKFFKKYHNGNYILVNLCVEKDYDVDIFEGNVTHFRFHDHNPPPLSKLHEFFLKLDEFLLKDEKNIVALHCKAGKGRTGTMIGMYMFHCGKIKDPTKALKYFGKIRTSNGKGVTIPSQRRYVRYYANCLSKGFPSTDRVVIFKKAFFSSIPHFDSDGGCDPYIIITKLGDDFSEEEIFDSRKIHKTTHYNPKKNKNISMGEYSVRLQGDVKFYLWDYDKFSKDDKMFWFWVNTNFITKKDLKVNLTKKSLDRAVKDVMHKNFSKDFSFTSFYEIETNGTKRKIHLGNTPNLGSVCSFNDKKKKKLSFLEEIKRKGSKGSVGIKKKNSKGTIDRKKKKNNSYSPKKPKKLKKESKKIEKIEIEKIEEIEIENTFLIQNSKKKKRKSLKYIFERLRDKSQSDPENPIAKRKSKRKSLKMLFDGLKDLADKLTAEDAQESAPLKKKTRRKSIKDLFKK